MQDITPINRTFVSNVIEVKTSWKATTYEVSKGDSTTNEPEEHNQARHAQDKGPGPDEDNLRLAILVDEPLTYKRFLRAHHKVNRKKTARTRVATLLAFVSKPHAMRQAPMKHEPR